MERLKGYWLLWQKSFRNPNEKMIRFPVNRNEVNCQYTCSVAHSNGGWGGRGGFNYGWSAGGARRGGTLPFITRLWGLVLAFCNMPRYVCLLKLETKIESKRCLLAFKKQQIKTHKRLSNYIRVCIKRRRVFFLRVDDNTQYENCSSFYLLWSVTN